MAVDNNANSFRTSDALSITDVQNTASFTGQGSSIGISVGVGQDKDKNSTLSPGASAGFGTVKGDAASTATGGISGIAGNTAVRTGDANTGLTRIFDPAKEQRELDARVAITVAFGSQASRTIGNYADRQVTAARALRVKADALSENDPNKTELNAQAQALEDNWGGTGKLRLLAHTVVGGLTGGVNGAVGAAAGTITAPLVAQALDDAGIKGGLASLIVGLVSTGAGAVAGGGLTGGATAFNEVTNNFLKHPDIVKLKDMLSKCTASEQACRDDAVAEARRLSDANNAVLLACGTDQKCVQDQITDYVLGARSFNLLYAADTSKDKSAFGIMSNMQTGSGLIAANLSVGNANFAQWQANNCVALTDAACGVKFQNTAAQSGFLSGDRNIGAVGILSGAAGAYTSSLHQYGNQTTVCQIGDAPCTESRAYAGLLSYPAPGSSGVGQITNGGTSQVAFPVIGTLGHFAHLVDPTSMSIVNITLPDQHGLDLGFVVRSVNTIDSRIGINTYGAGTGSLAFVNSLQPVVDFVWGLNVVTNIRPADIPPPIVRRPQCSNSPFVCK